MSDMRCCGCHKEPDYCEQCCDCERPDIAKLRAQNEELIVLLKRNLERMKLINAECLHDDLRDCPNHNLMRETEQALKSSESENKGDKK